MLIHDTVDVFLYVGKTVMLGGSALGANIILVFFFLAYFLLRIAIFGKLIYISTMNALSPAGVRFMSTDYVFAFKPTAYPNFELSAQGLCVNQFCVSTYYILTAGMMTLYAMHIYWFYLILLMIKKAIFGKKLAADIREESDDD